ncbi:MAG TPA: hypothetical protein VF027_08385 [Sphingomicrobium sp.]
MKLALFTAIGAGAVAIAAAVPADAQRYYFNSWRTIGYKTVDGRVDRDRIHVRGDRRFRAVRLCVFNAPLVMRDFDIRYDNGRGQDVRVRQRMRAGTCTRVIDLAGRRRDIRYIELTYSPIRRGFTRPIVRVQAR